MRGMGEQGQRQGNLGSHHAGIELRSSVTYLFLLFYEVLQSVSLWKVVTVVLEFSQNSSHIAISFQSVSFTQALNRN